MQAVVGKFRLQRRWQTNIRKRLAFAAPQRVEAMERRPVVQPERREPPPAFVAAEFLTATCPHFGDFERYRLGMWRAAHVAARMQYPGMLRGIGARVDRQFAGLRIERDPSRRGGASVERQKLLELPVLQRARPRTERLACRGERHLDVARSWKDDGAAEAMVGEIRSRADVEVGLP